jgi:hypothetical protein
MPKPKRKKEIVLFALDVIFFVAAFVPTMQAAIRWILWFTCWTMTAILAQIHFEAPKEIKQRVAIVAASVLLFVACFQSLARAQWKTEKAAALEGQLCSFRSFWGKCYTPPIPIIEIGGDSGSKMIYVGQENSVDFGVFARMPGCELKGAKTAWKYQLQCSTDRVKR